MKPPPIHPPAKFIGYTSTARLTTEEHELMKYPEMDSLPSELSNVPIEPFFDHKLTLSETPEMSHGIAAALIPKLETVTRRKNITIRSTEMPGLIVMLCMIRHPLHASPVCIKRMQTLFKAINMPKELWPTPVASDISPYQIMEFDELVKMQTEIYCSIMLANIKNAFLENELGNIRESRESGGFGGNIRR